MKRVRLGPSLRSERVFAVVMGQLAYAKRRGARVVHFSVQEDHLHLMVEAADGKELARAMQLLFSRVARAVNSVLGRRGSLFADRHHRHELSSPSQVRNVLAYIFFNTRKHAAQQGPYSSKLFATLDAMSSAPWFVEWHPEARPPPELVAHARRALARAIASASEAPWDGGAVAARDATRSGAAATSGSLDERVVSAPRTWLVQEGWQRAGGPIRFDARPRLER